MDAAARAAGRDVDSITLLAVSKGQTAARIQQAIGLGLTDFGENYAAEALPKIRALRSASVRWHFIGRLQANKTREVAAHFDWVHGVDRLRVAERLAAQRGAHAPPLNVCVQVNLADDPDQGGVTADAAPALMDAVAALPRLKLRGLMCILPYEAAVATQHELFARLRMIRDTATAAGHALDTLSMGMSGDFEAAIAEGATLLRIGTALFGPRS